MKESENSQGKAVVVTGMGIFSSTGANQDEFSASLKAGESGIKKVSDPDNPDSDVNIFAKLPDFDWKEACHSYSCSDPDMVKAVFKAGRRASPTIQVSLLTALEASSQAGLASQAPPLERQALVVGGNNLNAAFQYQLHSKFCEDPEYLSPRYALRYMDTDHLGVLSHVFQIKGEGFTVGGASASGNVALIKACQLLKYGGADMVWTMGAMSDLSPMERRGFYNIGAMGGKNFKDQPDKACRPFDQESEGFIYGQAGACLILETLESAQKRGAEILAQIAGGSMALAAHSLSQPDLETEVRVMRQALKEAGVKASDVDYLNAHGTSSPLGDKVESEAIRRVFPDSLSRLLINSTKGLLGHCLTAAGAAEAVASIIQMREGFVHPNKNLELPIDNECRFSGSLCSAADLKTALSNSFGFGGIHSSIVIKKGV